MRETASASLWESWRFTILLGALVINIALAPVLANISLIRTPPFDSLVGLLLFLIVVASAMSAIRVGRRRTILVGGLATFAILAAVVDSMQSATWATGIRFGLDGLFLIVINAILLGHILRTRRVTPDLISAALSVYILLGLFFSALYGLTELLVPGSFHVPDGDVGSFAGAGSYEGARRLYFSFITLLTVGYGDIHPLTTPARFATMIEAFFGQIIMVVLVARLVGIHVAQSFDSSDPD